MKTEMKQPKDYPCYNPEKNCCDCPPEERECEKISPTELPSAAYDKYFTACVPVEEKNDG